MGMFCFTLILHYLVHTAVKSVIVIVLRIETKKVVIDTDIHGYTINFLFQFALSSLILLSWIFKNFLLLTWLVVECENIYSVLNEVETVCMQIISSRFFSTTTRVNHLTFSDAQKSICKNIRRARASNIKKLNVFGLFTLDYLFLLHSLGLLISYIFVVLQFEFL
ncbi:hypothetical protein HF086_006416 [Spodoptera exigua]|uniref:Gustatory receptor n=1 Tax=Spodoptera exigua TaxID=7107 RepID=A0A922SPB3_SPOEX|nr:hypothetical protein HF086_006416 [Spodoptera exigua]